MVFEDSWSYVQVLTYLWYSNDDMQDVINEIRWIWQNTIFRYIMNYNIVDGHLL